MKSLKVLIAGVMFAMLFGLVGFFSFGSAEVCYGLIDFGGEIYIDGGASFTMSGGTLSSPHRAEYGGAVFVGKNSTFTLAGGILSWNRANSFGGAVYDAGTMVMTSGSIEYNKGNNGGGVFVASTGKFTCSGGTITNNSIMILGGGGVRVNGTFDFKGGSITNNSAPQENGGGVFAYNTMTMSNGDIKGNDAGWGGGIYVGVEFTMSGGTISGNEASDSGGGVYVWDTATMSSGNVEENSGFMGGGYYIDPGAVFNFSGGNIRNNKAPYGGGIYDDGVVNMSGGTISGNTATSHGKGVYISSTGTFNYSGGTISDEIYLEKETSTLVLKKEPTSTLNIQVGYTISGEVKIAKLDGISTLDLSKINVMLEGAQVAIKNIDGANWVVVSLPANLTITLSRHIQLGLSVAYGATLCNVLGSSIGDSYTTTVTRGTVVTYSVYSNSLIYITFDGKDRLQIRSTSGYTIKMNDGDSNVTVNSDTTINYDVLVSRSALLLEISDGSDELDGKLPKVERGALFYQQQAVLNDKKFVLEPVKDSKIA